MPARLLKDATLSRKQVLLVLVMNDTAILKMEDIIDFDLQVFQEKSRAFCGSVKVSLENLAHEVSENPRQLDHENVLSLMRKFREDDCLRLEPEHSVSAQHELSISIKERFSRTTQ